VTRSLGVARGACGADGRTGAGSVACAVAVLRLARHTKGFRAGLNHAARRRAARQPLPEPRARTARLLDNLTGAIPALLRTHLALSAAQIDADMIHRLRHTSPLLDMPDPLR
jgi:hypothetical protein